MKGAVRLSLCALAAHRAAAFVLEPLKTASTTMMMSTAGALPVSKARVEVKSDEGLWVQSQEATHLKMRVKDNTQVSTSALGIDLPAAGSTSAFNVYPSHIFPKVEKVEGGGTVRTYQMPPWADRCQMLLATNGRPLKAKVELWNGPEREDVHLLLVDSEDGLETPVQATLAFKPMSQVLKISASGESVFPLYAGVSVPPPARSAGMSDNFEGTWGGATKGEELKLIQGGAVSGKGGAVRVWSVEPNVKSVQILATSRNTGGRSFRVTFDVLQGPNNKKQSYFLFCGGATQPYQMVVQTPGAGCAILVKNLKPMEDGNVELAVVPYEYEF